MRLQICHLSDIHFLDKNNSLISKQESLCRAILESSFKNEKILFLISGDIAQSGMGQQYDVAFEFFTYIKNKLTKEKNIISYFFFAPGNHDCLFIDDDYDEQNRRKRILDDKDNLDIKESLYYQKELCKKQMNYFDFIQKFNKDIDGIKEIENESPLIKQYEIKIDEKTVNLNILNTSWVSQKKEKPGELFIPKNVYENTIVKKDGLNITMYHHPSNWMHPNDKLYFDSCVMPQSDILYMGHEHVGRNEEIKTRNSQYDIQYGEVLQDLQDRENSAFIINYIEGTKFKTNVYKWDNSQTIYHKTEYPDKCLGNNINKSVIFTEKYREYLNSFDMQVTHPYKKKMVLSDLYIFPNVEEYNNKDYLDENSKDRVIVRGNNLISYIIENKIVEFSGGSKSGKTALTKMIALSCEKEDIHGIILDCKKERYITPKNFENTCDNCIKEAYGSEKLDAYRQLSIRNKVLIIDNIDEVKQESNRQEILKFAENFFEYIVIFTGMSYELTVLENTIKKDGIPMKHCNIKEFGHKQRNELFKKWYSLNEGDDILVDDEIAKHVKEATNVVNTLKGNGYMPCIAPNLIIILQQLEFQSDTNQERSNYGYMYEFLITKSILDMKKNNQNIHDDIASGILIKVAQKMFEKGCKIVSKDEFFRIIQEYCDEYLIDVSKDIYLSGYLLVDLLEEENEEVKFKYPYIHYYYTAKYLSTNIEKESVRHIVDNMAASLYNEECGDIMIFLCHLSKNDYIIECVLDRAKEILSGVEQFDFEKYKSLKITIGEYIDKNMIPEKNLDERQDEMLERKDAYEESKLDEEQTEIVEQSSQKPSEQMQMLDCAYKSIEVMGQILKNYPGTIEGKTKINLLEEIHNLGMRTLTYTYSMLHTTLESALKEAQEKVYKKLQDENIKQDEALDIKMIWNQIKMGMEEINNQMDNIFGLMSYTTIRRLSNSVGNETLKTLLLQGGNLDSLSYELIKNSTFLNEYGIIRPQEIIDFHKQLKKDKNIFAENLLRLLVYEHYYVFGSKDLKTRQKIWHEFNFDNDRNKSMLLNNIS